MKRKIIISLIIIIMIICNFQYSLAASNWTDPIHYYSNDTVGVLAYKQINAFKLTLADGSTLADATISTDSELTVVENMKPVEIVFVLDNSGSMKGTKIQTLISSMNTLVESLFEKIGEDKLKIGLIRFNSNIIDSLELTKDKTSIQNYINKMNANGGTEMSTSIDKANEWLTKEGTNDKAVKIVCTLTDGILGDTSVSITSLENSHESGISTFSIFVDVEIPNAFDKLKENDPSKHQNFSTNTSGFETTITNDIYNAIYQKSIELSPPQTVYNLSNAGIIAGDDKIILQIDNEILHGATLQIEYVISVTATFDSNEILITDYYNNPLTFNKSQKMLTENKTNKSYGWEIKDGYLINYDNQSRNAGQEHRIKLILSTTITPAVLEDLQKIGNHATFQIRNSENNQVTSIISSNDGTNIKALDILIIPPTGILSAERKVWTLSMTVATISIGLIIICIIDYIKTIKVKNKQKNNK